MLSDPYNLLILFSILTLVSYVFNIISDKLKVPSVILLLCTGILFKELSLIYQIKIPALKTPLELLGIIGLIMIVLEGSLDLKIDKNKSEIILKSFLAGALVLLFTSFLISIILFYLGKLGFRTALVYAVPMGVISSAIAIPTASNLSQEKKEFITYESTFSDILGIMLFNYVIAEELLTWTSLKVFGWSFLLILYISVSSTLALLWLSKYLKSHLRVLPILSLLVLLYALAKLIHLPSLFLILTFGLVFNNISIIVEKIPKDIQGTVLRIFDFEKLSSVGIELKSMTRELAFLIRTFFFLMFGYTIDLSLITSGEVVLIGSLIIGGILAIRYFFLRFILKSRIFPELFIAPRGLITILLFYSIPVHFKNENFNEGVLIFVIVASSMIMMLGILLSGKEFKVEDELQLGKDLPDTE